MKRIFCLLLTATLTLVSTQAAKYALVIGIGDYPEDKGWSKINGDKDIPYVEETLITNGFKSKNIVKLKNEQATCAAICREFENLISRCSTGDSIYIHFSGHGQQITDLNGDEIEDELDEAWIPYDAHLAFVEGVYEGENHLVDDQINGYLHRLRENIGQNGKIIVVADACHSGDSTRGDETDCIRGTDNIFTISNIKNTIQRFCSIFTHKESAVISQSNITKPQNTPMEWVFISACQDYQVNREYKGLGSLTTALYNVKDLYADITLESLYRKIKSFFSNNVSAMQRPQIEHPNGVETQIFW